MTDKAEKKDEQLPDEELLERLKDVIEKGDGKR